jgi:hypothetical protein
MLDCAARDMAQRSLISLGSVYYNPRRVKYYSLRPSSRQSDRFYRCKDNPSLMMKPFGFFGGHGVAEDSRFETDLHTHEAKSDMAEERPPHGAPQPYQTSE